MLLCEAKKAEIVQQLPVDESRKLVAVSRSFGRLGGSFFVHQQRHLEIDFDAPRLKEVEWNTTTCSRNTIGALANVSSLFAHLKVKAKAPN